MKKKLSFRAIITISVLLIGNLLVESFAQRQKITNDYYKETDYGMFDITGKQTYYYIVGEDGNHLKDGPQTIVCPQKTVTLNRYTFRKLSGSYNLNANHSKGNLHGAISSNYKVVVTRTNGNAPVNEYKTLSGSFMNGIPNGKFVVKTNDTKLSATYKNGLLVGAFSCDLIGDDHNLYNYNGSLTSTGQLTGTWTYQTSSSKGSMQFQNGVLIIDNDARSHKSTAPAISALAKQYAAGLISKDELFKKGYLVLEEEIKLGSFAYTCITRRAGVDFSELSECEFSQKSVSYEYLHEICLLNRDGVEVLLSYLFGQRGELPSGWKLGGAYPFTKDENGDPYIIVYNPQDYKQFLISGWVGEAGGSLEMSAYITKEDIAYMNAKFTEVAKPIMHYIDPKHIVEQVEQRKCNIPNFPKNGTDNEKMLAALEESLNIIDKQKKSVTEGINILNSNSNFVNIDNSQKYIFFKENSIQELKDLIEELKLKVQEEKIIAEQERVKEELRIQAEIQAQKVREANLKKAIDFILALRDAKAIAKSDDFDNYLIFEGENKKKVKDVLKKFCPVVGIEIINITEDSIKCHWTKESTKSVFETGELSLNKEKVQNTYELALKHTNNKLVINEDAFNIDKAKLISSKPQEKSGGRSIGKLF